MVLHSREVLRLEVAFMQCDTIKCHFMWHFIVAHYEFMAGDNYYQSFHVLYMSSRTHFKGPYFVIVD
jgi:hypothetical protein